MHYVVVQNDYLHSVTAIVGPFDSKQKAQDYASEKDWQLSQHERFQIREPVSPDAILTRTYRQHRT